MTPRPGQNITCECQHYAPTAIECALKAWSAR